MPTKKKPKFRVGQVAVNTGAPGLGYVRVIRVQGYNLDGDVEYAVLEDGASRSDSSVRHVVRGEWSLRPLTAREVGPGWKRVKGGTK